MAGLVLLGLEVSHELSPVLRQVHQARVVDLVHLRLVVLVLVRGVDVLPDRVLRSDQVLGHAQVCQQRAGLLLQVEVLLEVGMQVVLHPLVVFHSVVVCCPHHRILCLGRLPGWRRCLLAFNERVLLRSQVEWKPLLALVTLEDAQDLVGVIGKLALLPSDSAYLVS